MSRALPRAETGMDTPLGESAPRARPRRGFVDVNVGGQGPRHCAAAAGREHLADHDHAGCRGSRAWIRTDRRVS